MSSKPKPTRSITLRVPPAWLVSQLAILALVGGLIWSDREYWHWYSHEPNSEQVEELSRTVDKLKSDVQSASATARAAERKADNLAGLAKTSQDKTESIEPMLVRMASGLAIVSLVQNKGGVQSTGSAQGKACIVWFLLGEGSMTDCGFSRTE